MLTVFLEHIIDITIRYIKNYQKNSITQDSAFWALGRNANLSDIKRTMTDKLIKDLRKYKKNISEKETKVENSLANQSISSESSQEPICSGDKISEKQLTKDDIHLENFSQLIDNALKSIKEEVIKAQHKSSSCEAMLLNLSAFAKNFLTELKKLNLLDQSYEDLESKSLKPLAIYIFYISKYLADKEAMNLLESSYLDPIINNPKITNLNMVEREKRKVAIDNLNKCRNKVREINPHDETKNADDLEKTLVSQALQKTIEKNGHASNCSSFASLGDLHKYLKLALEKVDKEAFNELFPKESSSLSLS